jgi:hypothetical protein
MNDIPYLVARQHTQITGPEKPTMNETLNTPKYQAVVRKTIEGHNLLLVAPVT